MLVWQVRELNAGYSRARERARREYHDPNNNGHYLPLPCLREDGMDLFPAA
jgi:hypothetical protein